VEGFRVLELGACADAQECTRVEAAVRADPRHGAIAAALGRLGCTGDEAEEDLEAACWAPASFADLVTSTVMRRRILDGLGCPVVPLEIFRRRPEAIEERTGSDSTAPDVTRGVQTVRE